MDDFRRAFAGAQKGPGGWRCPCCGHNTFGGKRRARRYSRRTLKHADRRALAGR